MSERERSSVVCFLDERRRGCQQREPLAGYTRAKRHNHRHNTTVQPARQPTQHGARGRCNRGQLRDNGSETDLSGGGEIGRAHG